MLIAVLAVALEAYPAAFGGVKALVQALDHSGAIFGDFLAYYWPQAQQSADVFLPVTGFTYPPTAAWLLHGLFAGLSQPLSVLIWGALMFLATAWLWWLGYAVLFEGQQRNPRTLLAWLTLCALSHPLVHAWVWGQVSILLTAIVLTAVWAIRTASASAAAMLVALAASLKIYPALFALLLVPQGSSQEKRIRSAAIFLTAFALALTLPALEFPWRQVLVFNEAVFLNALSPPPDWRDPNAQSLAGVLARCVPGFSAFWARWVGVAGLGLLLALHARASARRGSLDVLGVPYHAALIFCALPLVVASSWPHYFVFLPFTQTLAWRLIRQAPLSSAGRNAAHLLLGASVLASGMPGFLAMGSWMAYAAHGCLFWADMAVLLILLAVPVPARPGLRG